MKTMLVIAMMLGVAGEVAADCRKSIDSTAEKVFAAHGGAVGQTDPGQPVNRVSALLASVTRGACVGQSYKITAPAWVEFVAPTEKITSSRTFYFHLTPNTGVARSGEIVVEYTDKTIFRVPVSQAGGLNPACTYSVSPASITIPVGTSTNPAGNLQVVVSVTTQAGCPWGTTVAGPRPAFLANGEAVVPASGIGSGSFVLSFNRFVTPTTIRVTGQTIAVVR